MEHNDLKEKWDEIAAQLANEEAERKPGAELLEPDDKPRHPCRNCGKVQPTSSCIVTSTGELLPIKRSAGTQDAGGCAAVCQSPLGLLKKLTSRCSTCVGLVRA